MLDLPPEHVVGLIHVGIEKGAEYHIEESLDSISSNYDQFSEKQKEIVESYNRNISEMIEQNKERIEKLDKELGNELEKSLESLGSSLSTLSSKFASDYGPITDKLTKLLDSLK